MKKIFLTSIVLVLGTYFFLRSPQITLPRQEQQEKEKKSSSTKKMILGPRKQITNKKVEVSKAVDHCDELQSSLEKIDFNLPKDEWLSGLKARSFSECKNPGFTKKLEAVETHCFKSPNADECVMHLVFLRSLLRTQGISDGEDRETIADLILSQFSHEQPDFKKLEQLTSKLMDLDPSGTSVQKLWAMSKLLSYADLTRLPPELSSEIYSRVDPELLKNKDMLGLNLILENGVNPDKIENSLRQRIADAPEESYLHETLGWALWSQGKRAEAMQELNRAIELNPDDKWLRDMRTKINSGKADAQTYQGRLSLGVNTDDLFN